MNNGYPSHPFNSLPSRSLESPVRYSPSVSNEGGSLAVEYRNQEPEQLLMQSAYSRNRPLTKVCIYLDWHSFPFYCFLLVP